MEQPHFVSWTSIDIVADQQTAVSVTAEDCSLTVKSCTNGVSHEINVGISPGIRDALIAALSACKPKYASETRPGDFATIVQNDGASRYMLAGASGTNSVNL